MDAHQTIGRYRLSKGKLKGWPDSDLVDLLAEYITASGCGGALEGFLRDRMPASVDGLREHTVLYVDGACGIGDAPGFFSCQAEDTGHAVELCEESCPAKDNPGFRVIWACDGDAEGALDDYLGHASGPPEVFGEMSVAGVLGAGVGLPIKACRALWGELARTRARDGVRPSPPLSEVWPLIGREARRDIRAAADRARRTPPGGNWVFEVVCGYHGWRCRECGTWVNEKADPACTCAGDQNLTPE